MGTPTIAGMLRVKNEARWIAEVIDSLKPVCRAIVVFDDHSTDGTPEICERAGCQVMRSTFDGLNEVRDKNALVKQAQQLGTDWILCIDGDEVLEPTAAMRIVQAFAMQTRAYSLKVEYLWDRPDQIRTDGIYARFYRPSLFNARRTNGVFGSYIPGQKGGMHCSNVPEDVRSEAQQIPVRLKHYGYMDKADRLSKWSWYNSIDPDNRLEDGYRHIVQGDVEEVPVDAKLLHAGPLRLAPWH